MSWNSLPREIRNVVLGYLAEAEHFHGNSLAGYARVTSEWQPVFENFTFRSIKLASSETDNFRLVFRVARRKKYLRYLGFVLELPEHKLIRLDCLGGTEEEMAMAQMIRISKRGCGVYSQIPDLELQEKQNNMAFTKAIVSLLSLLSEWIRQDVYANGVSLELIADSKSYWQYMSHKIRAKGGPMTIHLATSSLKHWQSTDVDPDLWQRCLDHSELDFHSYLGLDFTEALIPNLSALPKTQAITTLSILRKTIRHLGPRAVCAIMHCLPNLVTFNWELWPRAHWKTKHAFDDGLVELMPTWPRSLTKVRIAQIAIFRPPTNSVTPTRHNPHLVPLAHQVARLSQDLSCLSIEYSIDIHAFLAACPSHWPHLRRLAIRSEQRVLEQFPQTSNYLIQAAAKMALGMHEPKIILLYSLDASGAAYFSYELHDNMTSIRVGCSWDFEVSTKCLGEWQAVARKHQTCDPSWRIDTISLEAVRFSISRIVKRHFAVQES